jgi:ribose transport system ATP-binding protein
MEMPSMNKTNNSDVILETRGIIKDFPGQRALDNVDFDVRKGEVHALIGENGAGKSTLIKIIAGLYHADQGEVLIDGAIQNITNTHESQELGLSFIHQELNIVPHLSVAENIFLGVYPHNKLGIVRLSKMVEKAKEIPDALSIGVDLRTPVSMLSVIQQWKTVINRALALQSRIIFMDEPTASLTYEEVKKLFHSIAKLRDMGKAIVYVSHRMEEVFKIADRVTVIKDAKKVGTVSVAEVDSGKIYQMMLGRELKDIFPPRDKPQEKICLEVKSLSRGHTGKEVSFHLKKGEILGLAGLVGSGRTELARLLFGADQKDGGEIFIDGKKASIKSPLDAIRAGIALVPEERRSQGLILPMDVKQNITLASLSRLLRWPRIPLLSRFKERSVSQSLVESTGIMTPGLNQIVQYLSGGNQQKVVLAKWLCSEAKILIFDEPTRGIDVGAKFAIYELLTDLARRGAGIILISSDLTEVVGLSHRILVMNGGMIQADLMSRETDLASILELCLAGDEEHSPGPEPDLARESAG